MTPKDDPKRWLRGTCQQSLGTQSLKKHTAPIVAQRVLISPGCVVCAAHAAFEAEPVNDDDKEEVEELQPPHIVSFLIKDKYKLVDKPALLRQ